jgi:hypothetical protein
MLEIPQKFQNDIQGRDYNLTPLIIIDDRIYLSTMRVELENIYSPLVKKIGSINQSIDLNKKNFKISNLNISLYNAEYNDNLLLDQLFNPSAINKKVEVYHMTQSAQSLDDCLKVYTGLLKQVKEKANDVDIYIEDQAEKTLHKSLPIEYVRDDIEVPDRYKNKRVPMVYGYVENAPCVYYNIYQSSLENGSTKYSITPDSFAINLIQNPKVFDNDIYLNIRPQSVLFSQESAGTLYESSAKDQFSILSNIILVDKQLNVSREDVGDINSYDGTPMAYNLVEITHKSPVVFIGGTYDLHYTESGQLGQKRSASVQMFADIHGNTPSTTVNGSYFDVKDFGEIPEVIANPEYWLFGGNTGIDTANYDNIYGETIMNFEATQFASENKITKSLPTSDDEEKEVKGWVRLSFSLEAEVLGIINNASYPYLFFRWTDIGDPLWNVDSNDDDGAGIFRKSGATSPNSQTSDLSNRVFSITQRDLDFDSGNWILEPQNDGFKYLKTTNLEVERFAILDDFISYDIYADVYGRVDNVDGTYTGTQQYTSSQRQDYFEGRVDTDMQVGATGRLIKRPVARQIAKPTKRPTTRKQKIKTRTKY